MREAYFFCVKVSTLILLTLGLFSMLLSRQIVTVFRRDDLEVIRIGTLALRLQLCTLPLWGVITMSNMLTQSIGYGLRATLLAISRQGLCLIPLLLVLPRVFGLIGIQCAQPIADTMTFVLAILIVRNVLKELRSMPDKA